MTRNRFHLQTEPDGLTVLVIEGTDVVGSFSLTREDTIASLLGYDHAEQEVWRWHVETDQGNSGGGTFA